MLKPKFANNFSNYVGSFSSSPLPALTTNDESPGTCLQLSGWLGFESILLTGPVLKWTGKYSCISPQDNYLVPRGEVKF